MAVALLVLFVGVASAQTVVGSNITTNTTWTIGGSPYVIEGVQPGSNNRITVQSGATLIIDPGVEVRFRSGTSLETDNGGNIVAVGSLGDTIVFKSDAVAPATKDWKYIHVFSSTGSEFRYCKFEHAQHGLYVNVSSPHVQRCAFRRCENGLFIQSASPAVSECWITDSTMRGAWLYRTASEPTFYHCNFMRNTINVRLDGYVTPVEIEAESNWWGVDDETAIAATIQDGNDPGGGPGTVDFDPWLHQTPVEATSWGVIKALFR